MRSRTFICVAFLLACPAGVGVAQAASPGAGSPFSFPDVPGFVLKTEATVYEPSNLWDFIDGAADLFVSYRFVDLRVAYYRSRGGIEIRAEVYKHATPEDAFGMYSQERSPGNNFIEVGTQGYAEEGALNFLSGQYYVKLSCNEIGDTVKSSTGNIARSLATALGQPAFWPKGLVLLPVEGRIPNSEQYIAESFLGYTFLHGAYTAQYRTKELFEVFVIPAESDSIAALMLADLIEVNHLQPPAGCLLTVPDAHQGEIALVLKGKYFGGVVHCKDASDRLKFIEILQSALP